MFSIASLVITRSGSSSSDTVALPPSVSGDSPQDARFVSSISGSNSFGYNHQHLRCRSEPPARLLRSCLKIETQEESIGQLYGSSRSIIRSPRQMAVASFRSISASMRSLSPRSISSPKSDQTDKAKRKEATNKIDNSSSDYGSGIFNTISSYFHLGSSGRKNSKPKNVEMSDDHHRASVRFDSVSIREYNLDVGVHPSVSLGPAVTFGWKYEDSIREMKINEYEMTRAEEHRRRGPFREMTLSSAERTRRLRASGISHEEIEECMTVVEEAKRKRAQTLKRLHHRPVEERLEVVTKGIKKALGLRKSSKKAEKELWADARTYFALRA